MDTKDTEHPLILFDGICNFCDSSVNYIIRHDKAGVFRFAALQSPTGQKNIQQFGLAHIDSIILVYQGKAYTKSSAVLNIAKILGGIHILAYAFVIIPTVIRDWAYGIVATYRYRWFGQKDQCMIPSPDIRQRFID